VVGITTAATMWAAAAVGMAAGAGFIVTSLYSTGIILAVLIILPLVETRIISRYRSRRMFFTVRSGPRPGLAEEVQATLAGFGVKSSLLSFRQCRGEEKECSLLLRVNVPARTDILEVVETLYRINGVDTVSFEE